MKKILPIGSIVSLLDSSQKIMIINRAPLYNQMGKIGYFDYSACIYPTGQTDSHVYFFNEEDIDKIYFEGYSDESEIKFRKVYEQTIAKTDYPKLHIERIPKKDIYPSK